ncbi:muconolactone Delta-isomerase family protein [Kitasatospora sp. NPDC059571]|uniref:muconolactone Delta-isomerase family protein n=1 Tax=Kitasatospora sp. NPDC059571 TaxID=3346871 RepID=UPI00368ED2B0
MKEFLVELRTVFPDDMEQAEIDRLRAAESVRAKELAADGHLVRLWRPVGEMRSIGLWRADDEADLRERVLGTLPLHPFMTDRITAVAPHPNDPGPAGPSA